MLVKQMPYTQSCIRCQLIRKKISVTDKEKSEIINVARPMGRRGEWRYIGLEGSLFNEWGDYYSFRKGLPDSEDNKTIFAKEYRLYLPGKDQLRKQPE